jgi:tetratricopeptide (TPR) repeat protein
MHSRALRARKQGDLQHAIELFKKAIDRDPQFTLAKANLAGVYLTLNRLEDVEMWARRVLEDRSDDASFHHLLGTALYRQGKFDPALDSFQRAGEVEPERGNHRFWSGASLSWLGNHREALAMFDRAAQLNEANVDARIGAAIMLTRLGKHPEAKERLRRCLEQFPESVAVKLNWARLLSAHPDSTRQEAEQALGLALPVYQQKNSVPAAVTVAMAYAAADDFSKAVEVQQWAVQKAGQAGDPADLPWLKRQLELYQNEKPCREPWNEARGYPAVKGLAGLKKKETDKSG